MAVPWFYDVASGKFERSVAGAAWAEMKTAFVARPGQQQFSLVPTIDITVPSLAELSGELERM